MGVGKCGLIFAGLPRNHYHKHISDCSWNNWCRENQIRDVHPAYWGRLLPSVNKHTRTHTHTHSPRTEQIYVHLFYLLCIGCRPWQTPNGARGTELIVCWPAEYNTISSRLYDGMHERMCLEVGYYIHTHTHKYMCTYVGRVFVALLCASSTRDPPPIAKHAHSHTLACIIRTDNSTHTEWWRAINRLLC